MFWLYFADNKNISCLSYFVYDVSKLTIGLGSLKKVIYINDQIFLQCNVGHFTEKGQVGWW